MVLAAGEILFEYIPGTVFAQVCISVVVFEMYSLISSLVIMRDREAGVLVGMLAHVSRFKYGQFRRQTGLFWSHVCLSRDLRQFSATRWLILNVSTCKVVCRRHDDPTNGPTGDPCMVRLP